MKIGIDTFACDSGNSGVGAYLAQILKRIPPSGSLFEMFGWEYDQFTFSEYAPNVEFIHRCRINGRSANALWHLYRYPDFAKSRSYSACFFPAAHRQPPYKSPCPTIGVVHDMAAYWGTRRTREHLGPVRRMVLPDSLRRLDRIIAVSAWVKQELIKFTRVKESLVEVVPNGVDHSAFYPRSSASAEDVSSLEDTSSLEGELLIQPFSFRRPYILYVSRIDHPVKNHIRLIEAFGIFKEKTGFPHRLVLAGSDSNDADKVKAAAAGSAWRGDIFFTGYFPIGGLPELYCGADFAVIPSIYEGFGMSVVEAMASGVPVACAGTASLPETAADAALFFDPFDPGEMADRMVTLASDHDLHRKYRQRGIERAQNFSWDRCAERTFAIINDVPNL